LPPFEILLELRSQHEELCDIALKPLVTVFRCPVLVRIFDAKVTLARPGVAEGRE
jgi:hypothetical protein